MVKSNINKPFNTKGYTIIVETENFSLVQSINSFSNVR